MVIKKWKPPPIVDIFSFGYDTMAKLCHNVHLSWNMNFMYFSKLDPSPPPRPRMPLCKVVYVDIILCESWEGGGGRGPILKKNVNLGGSTLKVIANLIVSGLGHNYINLWFMCNVSTINHTIYPCYHVILHTNNTNNRSNSVYILNLT